MPLVVVVAAPTGGRKDGEKKGVGVGGRENFG